MQAQDALRATLATLMLTLLGCGADELSSPTAVRLRATVAMVMDYAVNRGQIPPNEQALVNHLRSQPEIVWASLGLSVKDIDSLLVSQRDQQPIFQLLCRKNDGTALQFSGL